MNPRFPSPALFWANSPESVFLALCGHCTHKVARTPEKSTHIHLQTKLHPQSYQGPWTSEYHPLLRQSLSLPRTALIHPQTIQDSPQTPSRQSKKNLQHSPGTPRQPPNLLNWPQAAWISNWMSLSQVCCDLYRLCPLTWFVEWESLCCQGSPRRSRSRAAATAQSENI